MAELDRIDISELDPRIKSCRIEVACDITNPLTGSAGASAVFGRQKGATPAMVAQLDEGLRHYANVIKRYLGIDVDQVEGAGA